MVNISSLLAGKPRPAESGVPSVVVWHLTDDCCLNCRHCYSAGSAPPPMPRAEAYEMLSFLAASGVKALLASGGEPLMHRHFFDYIKEARELGLRVSVSSNGVLIDRKTAKRLADSAVAYVGISLDGVGTLHDDFRGQRGAYSSALLGIENCLAAGVPVGLRVTLAKPVLAQLPALCELAENLALRRTSAARGLHRICFYHFIPSGRGAEASELIPSRDEEDGAVEQILAWALALHRRSLPVEVLTVGEGTDRIKLLNWLRQRDPSLAASALAALTSGPPRHMGQGIASIRWDGSLFCDQFSWDSPLGRWRELNEASIKGVAERCNACAHLDLCGGSLRVNRGLECAL